jgi:hypothetical protein
MDRGYGMEAAGKVKEVCLVLVRGPDFFFI